MLPRASSGPPNRTGAPWRRVALLCAPVLYVTVGTFSGGEHRPIALVMFLVAFCVAVACALKTPKDATRDVVVAHLWMGGGLAVAIATALCSTRFAWAALLREVGALGATIYALRALFAIAPDPGLAALATSASNAKRPNLADLERVALALGTLAWGQAIVVDTLVLFHRGAQVHELAPLTATIAGTAALFIVGAAALVASGMRHLELGAPPRLITCAALAGIGLLFALALSFATTVRADGATALAFAVVAMGVARIARSPDARVIAARGRRTLTLTLFGGPVVTLAAIAATGRSSGEVVLVLAFVAMVVGAAASSLEEPLLPVKGVLLRALDEARDMAHDRDARSAIAQVLTKLREASGHVPTADALGASAELWLLNPCRVCSVDAAGYLHEREAELPMALFDVARDEPYATLKIDVLRALEIRRPDLRGLLRWLEDRGALSATIVTGDEEPDGLLIIPRGARTETLSLEEVRRLKRLADAFVSVCQAESARQRHLARERALTERLERQDDKVTELTHTVALEAARSELASSRLARPATTGIYSAASRLAYDALARRIERDAPVVVVAPAGVDPTPFIARAHLGGPRRRAPLVVVDGTSSREHDPARWTCPSASPLALADGGRLVLIDAGALPHDVQFVIARALGERRPPWERPTRLDLAVAITATCNMERLVTEGRLTRELFAHFEDAQPITLPRLSERAEDLFSIVADRLAREGLRVRGRPVGIDATAFARLVEHPFEGEDAELQTIVALLVAHVSGDVVRAADMDALGIAKVPRQLSQR